MTADPRPPGLPQGEPPEVQILRVLVALAQIGEFVALAANNPTAAVAAGLLAWTIRVLLETSGKSN